MHALSRAGAVCVPLGKYEDALKYFGKARELDPANGDNMFNYANACFFNKDNKGAFEAYVEAEKLKCSDDVIPRLYYQLALICSMRNDIKSALIYVEKCEKVDRTGAVSLNPDLISEKMKLLMLNKDYAKAANCAAQLVAIKPTELKNYMIYFSMLMANKDYTKAEEVLKNAKAYAEKGVDDDVTILLQQAAIYAAKAEAEPEAKDDHYNKAIELLERKINATKFTSSQKVNVLLTLAEVCMKAEKYNKSIKCLQYILGESPAVKKEDVSEKNEGSQPLSIEEIDAMMEADIELIQQKIDIGELSEDLGLYANEGYDEEGNLVPQYDESVFAMLLEGEKEKVDEEQVEDEKEPELDISLELREKVYFTLLSCYLAMNDFKEAGKYANILKYSNNKYYSYYGAYVCAMITKKLGKDKDVVEKEYSEAIALFRNKSFADHKDVLAVIFRARLYAEQGKYEKATELANLLAEDDKKSLLRYIEECKA